MSGLNAMLNGKDQVSGHIRHFTRAAEYENEQQGDLLVFQVSLDTGVDVYFHSTREYFEEILKRSDRPATFSGEFIDPARKKMICESIVFWDAATAV
jgi:hypothetical protein